jgi:hypothetical protein
MYNYAISAGWMFLGHNELNALSFLSLTVKFMEKTVDAFSQRLEKGSATELPASKMRWLSRSMFLGNGSNAHPILKAIPSLLAKDW